MIIKQISVFLENKSGRIYEVADVLGKNNINIHALSLADAADFGILRLIVDDLDKAVECLKAAQMSFRQTSVLAVEVPDCPGGLADVMRKIDSAGLNIEYMYSIPEKTLDNAIMIMRFDNAEEAVDALRDKGLNILPHADVLNL